MFRKFRSMVGDFLAKGLSPNEISFGVALGTFVGILPFLGLHTVIAVALAYVLRLNVLVVFLGTQISNPLSFPFILYISAQLGSLITGGSFLEIEFTKDLKVLKQYLLLATLGSVVLGLAVGTVSYFITLRFARRFRP